MVGEQPQDPVLAELAQIDSGLVQELGAVNAAAKLLDLLPAKYQPAQVGGAPGNRAWELVGLYFLNRHRFHEALGIFWRLYEHMLDAQVGADRVHKGMVLLWVSECFFRLGFPVHAKRYLMLTLCEDAISSNGNVSPQETGVYFRLVWRHGLSDEALHRYAKRISELAKKEPDDARFPEAMLQQIDDDWITEIPSPNEAFSYRVNARYVRYLLGALPNDDTGKKLELLAAYLMSCMPRMSGPDSQVRAIYRLRPCLLNRRVRSRLPVRIWSPLCLRMQRPGRTGGFYGNG